MGRTEERDRVGQETKSMISRGKRNRKPRGSASGLVGTVPGVQAGHASPPTFQSTAAQISYENQTY